jgi:hypothetical protein
MSESVDGRDRKDWELNMDRYLADLPWGVLAFLLLVVGGLVWTLGWSQDLSAGDYLAAVGTGSGLLAVGHGIRTRGR